MNEQAKPSFVGFDQQPKSEPEKELTSDDYKAIREARQARKNERKLALYKYGARK